MGDILIKFVSVLLLREIAIPDAQIRDWPLSRDYKSSAAFHLDLCSLLVPFPMVFDSSQLSLAY